MKGTNHNGVGLKPFVLALTIFYGLSPGIKIQKNIVVMFLATPECAEKDEDVFPGIHSHPDSTENDEGKLAQSRIILGND